MNWTEGNKIKYQLHEKIAYYIKLTIICKLNFDEKTFFDTISML